MTKKLITAGAAAVFVLVLAITSSAPAHALRPYSRDVSSSFKDCLQQPALRYKRKKPLKKNDCVKRLQIFLNEYRKWHFVDGGDISRWPILDEDGVFGPKTAKAVEAYQESKRGQAGRTDGIAGIATWLNVFSDCVYRWGDNHKVFSPACYNPPAPARPNSF